MGGPLLELRGISKQDAVKLAVKAELEGNDLLRIQN